MNPLPRGFIPGEGPRKALPWIHPEEDARLLACVEVPLCFRILYGFIAREGLRASEALDMTGDDLDDVRGVVTLEELGLGPLRPLVEAIPELAEQGERAAEKAPAG